MKPGVKVFKLKERIFTGFSQYFVVLFYMIIYWELKVEEEDQDFAETIFTYNIQDNLPPLQIQGAKELVADLDSCKYVSG